MMVMCAAKVIETDSCMAYSTFSIPSPSTVNRGEETQQARTDMSEVDRNVCRMVVNLGARGCLGRGGVTV